MAKSRKHPSSDESIHEKEAAAHKLRRQQNSMIQRVMLEGKYDEEDWLDEEEEIARFEPIKRKKSG